jgi:aspartyl-tRNA(Asn)/glutamyl-tRNA(Gln) amidotransferase subunit C
MALIDETVTRKVANLARLELTDHEIHLLTEQLKNTIIHIDLIQEVSTEQVKPTIHPIPISIYLRNDEPQEMPLNTEGKPVILDSAPEVLNDGFKVPQIV